MIKEIDLGSVATFSQGQQVPIPNQKTDKFDDCDRFIRIINYTQRSSEFRYIPKQDKKYHVKKDDIIMVRYGAVGFVGRGIEGVLANNMFKINYDKTILDGNYLFRILDSQKVQQQLIENSQSTSMAALNFKIVSRVKIPLPPLEIQKKIASILDAAEAYKQKTKALIDKYDALSQSLFLEMFGDPVSNPKGWTENSLKNITSKIGSGATPRGGKEAYQTSGISLIRSMNIHDNFFKEKDLAFIDQNQAKKLNNVEVKSNDVLINITGASVARCTMVPSHILPARVNQHVSILRPIKEKLNSVFLSNLLVSFNFKIKLLGVGSSNAATRESITKEQLESVIIITPPIKLQEQFAERVKAIEDQKILTQQSLTKSEDLFNSLLQKAFKGELV